ncbi:MAG: helix-turn-helix transcriptional regulator, partial [Clostridiales bacterium]|nr:helix-turn-helix transcriptional regulator [Clostridiales bacterium]
MVYKRLKLLRQQHNLSQERVAAHLFVNRRTYAAYETGTNAMSPETL